jgi:hypothetical protein
MCESQSLLDMVICDPRVFDLHKIVAVDLEAPGGAIGEPVVGKRLAGLGNGLGGGRVRLTRSSTARKCVGQGFSISPWSTTFKRDDIRANSYKRRCLSGLTLLRAMAMS